MQETDIMTNSPFFLEGNPRLQIVAFIWRRRFGRIRIKPFGNSDPFKIAVFRRRVLLSINDIVFRSAISVTVVITLAAFLARARRRAFFLAVS